VILILATLALAATAALPPERAGCRAADLAALGGPQHARRHTAAAGAPSRRSAEPAPPLKEEVLARARLAAIDAARRNEVDPGRLRLAFLDATSYPLLRPEPPSWARSIEATSGQRSAHGRRPIRVVASAVAEASAPVPPDRDAAAGGGRVLRPLVYRDGEG
jgi:hypothetical protein